MMILTLHNLAKTYKMLPSQVLSTGTTFDLYVLDTFHSYSKYQEAKATGKAAPSRQPNVDDMKAMMERAKNFKARERSNDSIEKTK